ncbi:MAG: Glutamate formimidoyltransferase [Fimbriimonadaceae bacterium]|nr:Glutamate formimidoyltransferase [Fimbriimonadaceae bacterium]
MRVLTVPNWSFGRDNALLRACRDILESSGVVTHFCASDIDHNRTVTAFSGAADEVERVLFTLADVILDRIDLNRHVGVHPRVGALDVCPFVVAEADEVDAIAFADRIGAELAKRYDLPVYLYEKSERGRHESDLPALRKGGFGGLIDRELNPDFGPRRYHPHLGVTVLGVRGFLIALNVNIASVDASLAQALGRTIREMRQIGDHRFLGVRALGFQLASREMSQVSMNLTLPDRTPIDPIVEWIASEVADAGESVAGTELIGVIRPRDQEFATTIHPRPEQVIEL